MRLQLIAALALVASTARADGSLSVRTAYYKERATRVVQPMLDAMFDAGERGLVTGHFLVDAITSASASSGAENAQPFTEKRYEGGLGYTYARDRYRVGGDAKYSTESDYRSFYAGARGEMDLNQKNTLVAVGGGLSFDTADNAGAQSPMGGPLLACHNEVVAADKSCSLRVRSLAASVSQLLGRNTVLGVSYDLSSWHGYQANPYRTAIAGTEEAPERHPLERLRQAFAASLRYYVSRTHTTVIGAYRYYRDDWEVHAHTPELRLVQEVGASIDATFDYRYYSQDGAYFYRDHYDSNDRAVFPYISDDVKLSTFTGQTFEAKLGILGEAFDFGGRWAGARFEGILEYAIQNNRFGNAIIAHVAVTVPFEY